MIFGIGTDIVHIPRIEACYERHRDRFPRRILTPRERLEMPQGGEPAWRFLAKRFAVKEAAAKALGTGFSGGVVMSGIGLGHDARGRPLLYFNGSTRAFVIACGITAAHVSLADEREFCIAFVTLVRDPYAGPGSEPGGTLGGSGTLIR